MSDPEPGDTHDYSYEDPMPIDELRRRKREGTGCVVCGRTKDEFNDAWYDTLQFVYGVDPEGPYCPVHYRARRQR